MSEQFPYLTSKILIQGNIETRTGLHIGAGDVGLTIGGADKLVVRSPHNDAPYIPGSSLKGKMRSILEKAGYAKGFKPESKTNNKGETEWHADPCSCGQKECPVCMIFGVPAEVGASENIARNSRLIVRDAHLLNGPEIEKWRYLDMHYTELKTEVAIDRLTAKANPRNFERVPAGAKFGLDMVLNIHDGDNEPERVGVILSALELLAADYLGGQGTRGYGAVRITVDRLEKLDIARLKEPSEQKEAWEEFKIEGVSLPWIRPR